MIHTRTLLCLALLPFIASGHGGNSPEVVVGEVVGVHDGDSLTLLTPERVQLKIRLEGIDAPELGQAFGNAAKKALSDLAFGRRVQVQVTGVDRYKRTLGVVFADRENVNLAMVRRGMAWRYDQYSKDAALLEAQNAAKGAKRGLWADASPVAPWAWRKSKKQN
jgi:micrococcal nuclease